MTSCGAQGSGCYCPGLSDEEPVCLCTDQYYPSEDGCVGR